MIDLIAEQIRNGKIIDIYSESPLYRIASAFNDYICNNTNESSEAYISYSEQSAELIRIRKELAELKQYKATLESKNNSLEIENQNLQLQVNESQEKEKQILKILKPEN